MTDIVERLRKQCTCEQCAWEVEEALKDAAAEIERLRGALRKCLPIMRKAHDRIHCLPRTSDTDLAETIDITLGVVRAALGEKE